MPRFRQWDVDQYGPYEEPTYPTPPPVEPTIEPSPDVDRPASGGGYEAPAIDTASLFQVRNAPGFKAPRFAAPSAEGLQADPGYQFRLGAGREALERGAAARGVLRTGGTLKDLLEYGQRFGSQEYEGAYNRALGAYDRDFQAARSEYEPLFSQWQAETGADLTRGQLDYGRLFRGGGGGRYDDIPAPP